MKAYAADFCGTEALSGASRELVESFISHLAAAAKENRDGLVCKLNSYPQPEEVKREWEGLSGAGVAVTESQGNKDDI